MNKVVPTPKEYTKQPLDCDQMLELLKSGWLSCNDENKVKHYLQHTWYYRLLAYFKSFQTRDDNFIPWITFDNVRDLYVFDRKLRLLTLDAIEKIEVSLKANMNDILSLKKWCFWYLDPSNFELGTWSFNEKIYNELCKKIDDIKISNRDIVKYYQAKYETQDLPSWILFQELSIWEISNIYNIFPQWVRQEIADVYGVYERDFKNWIQSLMTIRNICAHHGRLRNRRYIFKARANDTVLKSKFQKQKNIAWYPEVVPNYYNLMLIIMHLLKVINKNFDWIMDVDKLLKEHNNKYAKGMWLYPNWDKNM